MAAAWFGYWSLIYPSHAGSVGMTWGMLVIGWAASLALAVAWRLRRTAQPGE